MNNKDLIGLEYSDAEKLLRGKIFRLEYYTSNKQKIFDKEIVLRVKETDGGLVITVGRFLFEPQTTAE